MKGKISILILFLFLSGCVSFFNFDMDTCPTQNFLYDAMCTCPEARFNSFQSNYDFARYNTTSAAAGTCATCPRYTGGCTSCRPF